MKYVIRNKIRKITINDNNYLYIISIDNDWIIESSIFLKVFLENYKKTSLMICFNAKNTPDAGHLIYAGLKVINKNDQTKEIINIHQPKWVKLFILEGIKLGWTGKNSISTQNGVEIMENWGFEIPEFDK